MESVGSTMTDLRAEFAGVPKPMGLGFEDDSDTTGYNAYLAGSMGFGSQTPVAPDSLSSYFNYKFPLLAAGQFANTVASSVTLGAVPDDLMQTAIRDHWPSAWNYYNQQQAGVTLLGEGAGMFIPGTLAVKSLRTESLIGNLINKVPFIRSLLVQEKKMQGAVDLLRGQQMKLARGSMELGADIAPTFRNSKLAKDILKQSVVKGVKETTAFELGVYATMNQSELLFPQDFEWYDYAPYIAAGGIVGVGMEVLAARRVISEAGRISAEGGHAAANPTALDLTKEIIRPGFEDLSVTRAEFDLRQKQEISRILPEDGRLRSTVDRFQSTIQAKQDELSGKMAARKTQVAGITLSETKALTAEDLENLRLLRGYDPTGQLGIKDISGYVPKQPGFDPLLEDFRKAMEKLDDDILTAEERLRSKKRSAKEKEATREHLEQLRAEKLEWSQRKAFDIRNGEKVTREDSLTVFSDFSENVKLIRREAVKDEPVLYKVEGHVDPLTKSHLTAAVDYEFNMFFGKGVDFDTFVNQSPYARSMAFALYDHVIANIAGNADTLAKHPIRASADSHWIKLDAIDDAIRRGAISEKDVRFAEGFDLPQLRQKVLDKKYREFLKLYDEEGKSKLFKREGEKSLDDAAIRYMLNLPATQFGEISPLEELFHAFRAMDLKDLSKYNVQEIIDHTLKTSSFPNGLDMYIKQLESHQGDDFATMLRGRSYQPLKSSKGTYVPPLTVWQRNLAPQQFTRQAIDNDAMLRRNVVNDSMGGPLKDPATGRTTGPQDSYVAKMYNELRGMDAYYVSTRIDLVNEASRRGEGQFGYQAFATRDDPVFQALHMIETRANKMGVQMKNDINRKPFKNSAGETETRLDVISRIRSQKHIGDKALFAEYVRARRAGWILEEDAVSDQGKHSFVIAHDNAFNQNRWQKLFGTKLSKGTLMPRITKDGSYAPLEISDLAFDMARVTRDTGLDLLPEQNRLLYSMGENTLNKKAWWTPPPMYYGKEVAYVMQKVGEDKFYSTIVANTKQELDEIIGSPQVQDFLKEKDAIVRKRGDIEKFYTARSKAFFELLDAGDPIVKGTKAAKGTAVTPYLESGDEMLDNITTSFNKQIDNITRDTLQLLYEGQLAYAGRMHNVFDKGQNLFKREKATSIWDMYKRTILGERAISEKDFSITKAYNWIESHYDDALQYYWDITNRKGITGQLARIPAAIGKRVGFDRDQKKFDRLKEEMGPAFDFERVEDFLASNFNVKAPPTMKQHMAEISHMTSTITLRFMNLSHPLLNVSGLLATAPVVIKAMRQRGGESVQDWHNRIGAFSTVLPTKLTNYSGQGGRVINTPGWYTYSAVRHMASAASDLWSKEGRRWYKQAQDMGYIKAPVAEIHETLDDIQRSSDAIPRAAHWVTEKLSYLSDKSEEFTRAIAHMAGVRLAREHGIIESRNIHAFAHKFANDIIGDYRASNRPAMFQGSVGMPIGLFQTYMWNYFGRLFQYVENKQINNAARQFAMQAAIFGGSTVPGFTTFMDLWATSDDGRANPVDAIQARFGAPMADLLLYGSISNIPKIFGPDGLAIYTRGDASPRVPALLDPSAVPFVNLATSTLQGLGKAFDQMFLEGGQGMSQQMMLEIGGTYMNNRFAKGMFEVAAGYSVDRRSNVIADDVRHWFPIIARVIGVRPLSEAKAMEALRRLQVTEGIQEAQRTRLRDAIKTAFRGNDVDGDFLASAIEDYAQDGNPEYFPRFVKQAMLQGMVPKTQTKFLKLMGSDHKIVDALRLMNANVLDIE